MSLNLRSLTSALLRRRAGAVLVALQVAIALAIMVNAVYIVQQRVTWIVRPTGIDVTHLFVISSSSLASRPDAGHAIEEDLAYLRSLPNVISATASNSVPFNLGGNIGIWLRPGHQGREFNPRYLIMDSAGLGTLGAHLLAGRNFKPEEIRPPDTADDLGDFVSELIVSRAFARALFPSGSAVGKVVYFENGRPVTIIGIIDDLRVARASASAGDLLAIFPSLPSATSTVDYLVRTRAGERDAVMRDAALHLADSNPDRVINWARPLLLQMERRCGGSQYGDLPDRDHRTPPGDHLPRHFRAGDLQCQQPDQADRHPACRRRAQARRRGSLHGRERNRPHDGCAHRLRARTGGRLLALPAVRIAPPRPLLPGQRRRGSLGGGSARRLASGSARRIGAAVGSHAHGMTPFR